jgi:hypothetical protein
MEVSSVANFTKRIKFEQNNNRSTDGLFSGNQSVKAAVESLQSQLISETKVT